MNRSPLVLKIDSLALLLLPLLFYACGNTSTDQNDHLVFRYNEHANITSLDPAFAKDQRNIWACNQLYNSLIQLDDQLNTQPDIAKSWQVSKDAKTYTFVLRDDVFFHESEIFGKQKTRKVKAKDVVYSLTRLTDTKIASPGSWVMQQVKNISAKNDSVVVIELNQAFPAFLGLLSMKYTSIVPMEMENSDFRENPIGTGAFHFKRWEANEKLVFRKNDLYFEKDKNGKQLPYLEAVAITFLPDKQSEFLQFAQGKIDFLSGLDPSYKDELLNAKGELQANYEERIQMLRAPYLNTEYLGIYLDHPSSEIKSKKIRQAINYGFDRNTMITYLRNGIGTPASGGFIPKGLPGFSDASYYEYNPRKAKKLIEDYKIETGNQNPKISISTNASYLDLCEYIQRELQKVGLQVEIDVMPPSTLRQQRSAGKLASFRASWIADYPDAENYLSLFYSENFSPQGPNYTHFSSKKYDSLYEQSLNLGDLKQRIPLYQEMDSLIMTNAAVVPLYYDEVIRFTQNNVNGLGINPINLLDLKRVKKAKN
ncbi:peptide/nickel transport system substrate-binding protein [Mesonia algae]|uniref:Peptide/nickel transport system substrate-binding protein n=1 Tax=Mesonia algae TaxID=213248 RepID=A0A2W7I2Q1_9FLAO|nr:ABC transporter substrate-binding protein [Mesonia algae]PZW39545.1 peptide/nickel transport system substrate-binding protein [Mesonia algae]